MENESPSFMNICNTRGDASASPAMKEGFLCRTFLKNPVRCSVSGIPQTYTVDYNIIYERNSMYFRDKM